MTGFKCIITFVMTYYDHFFSNMLWQSKHKKRLVAPGNLEVSDISFHLISNFSEMHVLRGAGRNQHFDTFNHGLGKSIRVYSPVHPSRHHTPPLHFRYLSQWYDTGKPFPVAKIQLVLGGNSWAIICQMKWTLLDSHMNAYGAPVR